MLEKVLNKIPLKKKVEIEEIICYSIEISMDCESVLFSVF